MPGSDLLRPPQPHRSGVGPNLTREGTGDFAAWPGKLGLNWSFMNKSIAFPSKSIP